ncbi:alpha/beta fold hydrolase [Trichocoleus sp. FACHB-262]|uniref:alpha/beta fold hydrolase n=1 Tax=Trichocoleus sp. FACHB-262 TaxID=2692869 RepID=UPI001F5548AC|nr:alpha/beta hydrolase [Trichocoleus sp. FACHB-262]
MFWQSYPGKEAEMVQDWWQATFPQGRQQIQILDASGYSVAIAYGEKGSGPPLILVHGAASWSYAWRDLIDPLSQHFRVICFDAKGYGFSEQIRHSEVPGHQLVELARIIQALCPEPAIVVGQSLGALTAIALAETYPELVAQLVVINVPIFPKRLPTWGMQWMADIPLPLVQWVDELQLARPVTPLVHLLVKIARLEVMVDPTSTSPEEIYWLTYPYTEIPGAMTQFAVDMRQSAREIQALLAGQPNQITPIQDNLGAIACPTLILWGKDDRWFPLSNGEELHARLPHAQFQVIINCGHDAAVCCPDAISDAILHFLSDSHLPQPTSSSPA